MGKHRADTVSSAVPAGPTRTKPRHRRRRRITPLAPLAALVIATGGGVTVTAAVAHGGSDPVGLEAADASWTTTAAVMASRQELSASRSGGARVLLGADRLESIETEAKHTIRQMRIAEARRIARQEARERAEEQRRLERIAARQWGSPIDGYSISAVYGAVSSLWSSGSHTGVDLNAVTGTPVTSVGPGKVTFAGYDGSYGNKIIVRHENGLETWYCHLSAIKVDIGAKVDNRTVIGLVGATGNVTGDHLHLELRSAGGENPVDPVAGLAAHGVRL